ncbi:uncharacterized protein LOC141713846 [Apium graveolens]|uniref:uncharacterized protein LOC141713846 n=1 Tax=Apium graveolens TaxID=4045 RepID=UPI003D7B9EDA
MIYHIIPEEILHSLAEKKKAKDAWMTIKTMSQGAERVKAAKIQTLKSEFESLSMKDTAILDDFCIKINGLVTNIRPLGEDMKEAYVVKKMLRAVSMIFLQIVSTMKQFGDLETMTVEEVIGSLKSHAERLNYQSDNSGGQLMLTEEEWMKKESEGEKLLLAKEEWQKRMNKGGTSMRNRTGWDKSRVKCYNCGLYGYIAAECRKPRHVRDVKQEIKNEAFLAQMEDDEPALLLAKHEGRKETMLLNKEKVIPKLKPVTSKGIMGTNVWYLDNGASNHMTGDKSKFKDLDIILQCKNGEERTLHEVYYIPTLCSNIISLGQLSESENKVD